MIDPGQQHYFFKSFVKTEDCMMVNVEDNNNPMKGYVNYLVNHHLMHVKSLVKQVIGW